ncbi:MAG: hypothetical protein KJ893_04600 [Candidatus Omnitrophica bacterium]|nr:hypothetical protein [Candidatus Omnitrophota bacterium]
MSNLKYPPLEIIKPGHGFSLALAILLIFSPLPASARKLSIDKAVNKLVLSIKEQIQPERRVLIADLYDLDGRITHFGRYLSDKLQISLAKGKPHFTIVDRYKIDLSLQEFTLQKSGLIDESTIVQMGKMLGANIIIYGTVTDLDDAINIDIKIRNIETGIALGGTSEKLKKTKGLAKLVRSIIQSERQKEEALQEHRKQVLQEIEEDRQRRLAALEEEASQLKRALTEEEKEKRSKIQELDREIRSKSIVLAEYEKKQRELQAKKSRLNTIHAEIDRLNQDVLGKLKIGMTLQQVRWALGADKVYRKSAYSDCYISGQYFLLFEGDVLLSVVRNGSKSRSGTGTVVDDCIRASSYGQNVVNY